MKVRVSELDVEILYLIARGKTYKQISLEKKMILQTVKNRMSNLFRVFGCQSMPHLIAVLIASDVLRVPDLYQELDVEVFEYKRKGSSRLSYRLTDVRL